MNKIKEKVLKELNKIMLERVGSMKGYDGRVFNEKTDFFSDKEHIVKVALDKYHAEVEKVIDEVLTTTRRKANEEIKNEQSMAHTHTAINQIDNGIKQKLLEGKE